VADLSDEKIMLMVKDGYLSELTALFERYHVRLYNFFLRLTGDRETSEDLTQNLFYRIIKYRHTYNSAEGSFKSWTYQLARNVHYDHYKQEKKKNEQFKSVDHNHSNMAGVEEIYSEGDFDRLNRAMMQLKPEQREIIVLSRFEGLKYEEISQMMDVSVASIKVQMHRAIKSLRILYFNQQ